MLKVREIASQSVDFRFARAFSFFVGPRREYSYDDFAQLSGLRQRTIEGYARGECKPDLTSYMKISAVLGAPFVNRFHEAIGVGGAIDAERMDVCPRDMLTKVTALAHTLAEALENDQRVDHLEKPGVDAKAQVLAPILLAWARKVAA